MQNVIPFFFNLSRIPMRPYFTRLMSRFVCNASSPALQISSVVVFVLLLNMINGMVIAQTRPLLRVSGVDAGGKEISFDTLFVSESLTVAVFSFTKRIAADVDVNFFRERYCSLPKEAALKVSPLFFLSGYSTAWLNTVGARLRQKPALTLTLSHDASEKTKANALVLQTYLRETWGIDAARMSIEASSRKDGCIMLQGASNLFEPVVFQDTLPRCSPSVLRMHCTTATLAEPQQWAINIKQRGKALRSPITSGGRLRPVVDWKAHKELNGIWQIVQGVDSIRFDFEIRYKDADIPNERSLPVFVYTKRTRAQGADTVPSAKECRIEFTENAATLTAESLAAVRYFKQYLRLSGKEKLSCTMYAQDVSTPAFIALCKKRTQELARQLGCKESSLVVESATLPQMSPAGFLVEMSLARILVAE